MLTVILILLILFWFLGYGPVEFYREPIYTYNKTGITIWSILILLLGIWLVAMLPGPWNIVGIILFILWLFPAFGFFALDFIASFVLIIIIVSLVLYLLGIPH